MGKQVGLSARLGRLLLVWVLGITMSLHAADPFGDARTLAPTNRVVVPRLSGSVKIDGALDEPVWAKAAVVQPFVGNRDGSPEREPTELRLWYDNQALYLGWACQDTNIQATFTNRDDPLFQGDAVEFFVTAKELTNYFEFEWNPLGTVFDATIHNQLRTNGFSRTFQGDSSYTARTMENAAKIKGRLNGSAATDQGWSVEVRLPFADLGQAPPRCGEVWRINCFRVNCTQGLRTQLVTWSRTYSPSFHEPLRFGYLEFGE